MENPASRKRVAEQRIKQVVDPKLEKAKIGINKDKIARTTAKWQAEKQALENIIKEADEQMKPQQEVLEQKKQIAEETKKLTEKRKNSKSREEKKELTKKIDENQDAFEKLTYEEAGELFSKPKEVEEAEAKEQGEMQEFDKAMDENETPQKEDAELNKEPADIELDRYHENRKKQTQESIKELEEKIPKREKAKEEANGDMNKWNIFDEATLEQAKKRLEDLKKDRDFYEKNQEASSEKVVE